MLPSDAVSKLAQKTFWGVPTVIERLHGRLVSNLHFPPAIDENHKGAPLPAVLFLHGFGGDRHEHSGLFIRAASAFAQAGFIALRIDFRGAGETGGDTLGVTVETQIQDAGDALDHLRQLPFVDVNQIALLGLSFGGLTAACLAGRRRKDVHALILWEPVFDMKAVMKRVYGPTSIRAVRSRNYIQAGVMRLSASFFDALDALDQAALAASYDKPVLIVQGIADTVVPVETAYEWKRAYTATEVEVALIEDADHAFTKEKWAGAAIEKSVDWLSNTLPVSSR